MSPTEKPHKDNVPGPFYVCDGCCISCEIPFVEAPGMFAYDDQSHCYVSKQPQTKNELDKMIRAVLGSEVECIRYTGDDEEINRRLAEAGSGHLSDTPIEGIKPVSRNYVTFDAVDAADKLLSNEQLARSFQRFMRSWDDEYLTHKFTKITSDGETTAFSVAWYKDNFHRLEFKFLGEAEARWLIVSDILASIHDWLVSENRFCNIRWYTLDQWQNSKEWQETPF